MKVLIVALYTWGLLWVIVAAVCAAAYIRALIVQTIRAKLRP